MNYYERRFYEDIHKLVNIHQKILKELEKMNKPLEIDVEEKEDYKMSIEELLRDIQDARSIFVIGKYDIPRKIYVNTSTANKIKFEKIDMEIIIDDKIPDDKFKLEA